jgi:hypothetical protein
VPIDAGNFNGIKNQFAASLHAAMSASRSVPRLTLASANYLITAESSAFTALRAIHLPTVFHLISIKEAKKKNNKLLAACFPHLREHFETSITDSGAIFARNSLCFSLASECIIRFLPQTICLFSQ